MGFAILRGWGRGSQQAKIAKTQSSPVRDCQTVIVTSDRESDTGSLALGTHREENKVSSTVIA